MQFLYLYLVSVPIFVAIDLFWLRVCMRTFYTSRLSQLLKATNWVAAMAFYIIFNLGLTFFALMPAFVAGEVWYAVALGALFGFFTYATYDLTNQATIRGWPLVVTVVDIVWGAVLGGSVASLAYSIAKVIL